MARKSNRMSKKKPARAAAHSSSTNGTKTAAAKWVGQPIRRKEESRLVRGRGIFVDDEKMPGMMARKPKSFPELFARWTAAKIKSKASPLTRLDPAARRKFPIIQWR